MRKVSFYRFDKNVFIKVTYHRDYQGLEYHGVMVCLTSDLRSQDTEKIAIKQVDLHNNAKISGLLDSDCPFFFFTCLHCRLSHLINLEPGKMMRVYGSLPCGV